MAFWRKKAAAEVEPPDKTVTVYKVEVRTEDGTPISHHCSAVRANSWGQLWLMAGESPVAVYATGRWASWSVVVPIESRDPKPEESGVVVAGS
jgi:hypothetical protein